MKKIFFAITMIVLVAGCSMLEPPEGVAELSVSSVRTRTERTSSEEETVYCSADMKITNTGSRTIYCCTVNAVAASDTGIEHYISLSYDVSIPPSQSVYVTVEWSLVRQVETVSETVTESNSENFTPECTSTSDSLTVNDSTTSSDSTNSSDTTSTVSTPSGTDTTSTTTSHTGGTSSTTGQTNTSGTTTTTTTTPSSTSTATSTSSSTSTTMTKVSASNEETGWNKESIRILEYFFN